MTRESDDEAEELSLPLLREGVEETELEQSSTTSRISSSSIRWIYCPCRFSSQPKKRLQQSCFLFGSISATIGSICDFQFDEKESDDPGNSPHDPLMVWDTSKTFFTISTLLYLLDSIIHIRMLCSNHHPPQLENYNRAIADIEERTDRSGENPSDSSTTSIDSDRSISASLSFSVIFGIAALCDLFSSLTQDENAPWPSYILGGACVNLFFVCALISIRSKRNKYIAYLNSIFREDTFDRQQEILLLILGDLFFLMGCTVDVVVNMMENPWHKARWISVSVGSLISSTFWLTDAIIYQLVDADIFDNPMLSSDTAGIFIEENVAPALAFGVPSDHQTVDNF